MKIASYSLAIICVLSLLSSCNKGDDRGDNQEDVPAYLSAPAMDSVFRMGQSISVKADTKVFSKIDSISYFINNTLFRTMKSAEGISMTSSDLGLGAKRLTARIYSGTQEYDQYVTFSIKSDVVPHTLSYKLLASYPHDQNSFTQGLEYHNGVLYEGTGQYNESKLMKVNLTSGKAIRSTDMEPIYFGEGITRLNAKIYQLTYKEKMIFVYNDELQKQTQSPLEMDTKEGWGLTNDGKYLIASDGSNKLYYIHPEKLRIEKTIEVYDNMNPVNMLNELEYVDGYVWANRWQTDELVKIEVPSGRVVARLLVPRTIVPESKQHRDMDVLNGIAYNKDKGTFYLTGKYWPLLFEVKIQE